MLATAPLAGPSGVLVALGAPFQGAACAAARLATLAPSRLVPRITASSCANTSFFTAMVSNTASIARSTSPSAA